MTQSDEPPRAAVEIVQDALAEEEFARQQIGLEPKTAAPIAVAALRALPDAELWPLVAWLAQGREPTEAMKVAGKNSD
jgi:hypothetical protein